MNNQVLKRIGKELVVIIFFLIVAFIFLLKSPLHPWISSYSATDSSVFRTVAMMLGRGYTPYVESFDHKGPLIYFINRFGDLLFLEGGIWVLEYISLTITCYIMYRTARVFNNNYVQSVIAVFVGLTLLFSYFDGGNLVEEWSMPFISAGLYVFLDYICNNRITNVRLLLCGFCFGCVCMLRINMIVVWCVFCVAILVKGFFEKQYIRLRKYIVWFSLGVAICVVPILVWFWVKGAFHDFWFANFEFNWRYSANNSCFAKVWKAFFSYASTSVYLFAIISTCFLYVKKNKFLYGVYGLYLILNVCSVAISGELYPHYGMVLVPAVIPAVSGLFSLFNEEKKIGEFATILLAVYFVCNIFLYDWSPLIEDFAMKYEQREEVNRTSDLLTICELIERYTEEDDPISIYGNWNVIYILTNRPHATKFSYQFPIGEICPKLKSEYWEQLNKEKPKIVVIQQGYFDHEIEKFLIQNEYEMLWAQDGEIKAAGHLVYILPEVLDEFAVKIDLGDTNTISMSNANLVNNQLEGEVGIVCRGRLQRNHLNNSIPIEEYVRTVEYSGFKILINEISKYNQIEFYGKKVKDHGQPSVYVYDIYGRVVAQFTEQYSNIDNNWHKYSIDVTGLTGEVMIIFNGCYLDSTGSLDSEYIFSKVILQ